MWEMFLEKNNQRKIELIKTLERATELIVDKKKLLIDLEISEFVLNSTLEDIEIDLERFRLAKEFKIVVVNGSCSIESNGKVNSETLARQFAAESLFIKILISIFNEDSLSLNNFSEKNLVNYPSAHKTMKQLKVFFKKNSVNINKTMVFKPENEGHFRLLLVYIFNNLFRNNYSIYKDSQIREVDIYLKKNKHLLSEVKNSRINELKHFLIISIMRTSKGHSIKNAVHLVEINQIELVSQTKFKKSYSELLKIKLKSKAIRKNEKLHFKAYLISRGILKGRECSLPTVIQKLNSNFIKEISNRIPEGKELLSKSQEIKDHLTRIHFQTLLFPTIHNEDYKGLDFKFICDVHPKVFYIVQEYVIDSIRVESTVEKHKYFLFGEYTFLLINLLPLIHYTETVNLYLDFSYGELYNAFIQENLLFFSQIGLVITQEIDYSTDIVLTNRLDDILIEKIEYIVWLTPPRVVDWSALAELILIIKQKKYRAESDKRNSIEKG